MRREISDGVTWLIDSENNRVSIREWRDEKKATEWLNALTAPAAPAATTADCSGCSDIAPQKTTREVPVIEDIHRKLFAAVSAPGAFDVGDWHKCETTLAVLAGLLSSQEKRVRN